MHLKRCLAFLEAQENFHMVAEHIKGLDNVVAHACLGVNYLVLTR